MSQKADPKLFLFCIGGTGSRVLKSLTFLLAAGVDIKASSIIPIIIDPDRANGDMNRTIEILGNYQKIKKDIETDNNRFFNTNIQTLSSLEADSNNNQNLKMAEGFKFNIDGTKDGTFDKYIKRGQLSNKNRALIDMLFSQKNLKMNLKVGFKGNPHIGSIVLNQFKESNDFKYFASRFKDDDRIFVVSSIFGGTGAAGFPLLIKNIRSATVQNVANHAILRDAKVGALSVQPYFGVEPNKKSQIDKGTFIAKTKAALTYYARNLTGNKSVNAMYYLADKQTTDYQNNEGEAAQKNAAHLIELISALAIIDFMDIPDSNLMSKNGEAVQPIYKEYGLKGNLTELNFTNLGPDSRSRIMKNLTQYAYFNKYLDMQIEKSIERQPWSQGKTGNSISINRDFFSSPFYRDHLIPLNNRFKEWIDEMDNNYRKFMPFDLSVEEKRLHRLINGIDQKEFGMRFWASAQWDFSDFDGVLNGVERELQELNEVQKFMALFYLATAQIYDKRVPAQS